MRGCAFGRSSFKIRRRDGHGNRCEPLPARHSKWNKIEHLLFSAISLNWRGKPLITHEVIVSLIQATTNRKGLKVRAALDTKSDSKGIKVSDAEMAALNLHRDDFHGEWNYTLKPQK